MTSSFGQPRHDSPKTWKLAATAAVVVFLVAASVATYVVYTNNSTPNETTSLAAPGATAPGISMGTFSGSPNAAVDVPIRFAGVAGLGSASLTIQYDPAVVTIEDVHKGDVASSQLTWRHDGTEGTLVLLMTTSLPDGATGAGTLAFLSMKAKEGAVGEVSPLTVTVRSAVLADGETTRIDATNGAFHNGMPGDVNGDGLVDSMDYVRLARYLVGEEVTIVALNADLTGDGKVTDADAMKLLQRLDAKA